MAYKVARVLQAAYRISVFCHDFRAIGPVETMYVQQLAGLTWRRIRLERLEHRVTLDRLERYPTLEEFTQVNLNYPNGVENYLKGLIKIGDDKYSEYREKLKQVKGYQEAGLTIEAILWIPDHQEEIDAAITRVRDLRVYELMQMNVSKRAFDDLAREFDRTLALLRKQQEWRLRQGKVIDVTPTAPELT